MLPLRCANPSLFVAAAVVTACHGGTLRAGEDDVARDWRQWGGPDRNFVVQAPPLASSWSSGRRPVELFRRSLEGGHSAISTAEGRLFVVDGEDGRERVQAIDQNGDVLWSRRHSVGYDSRIAAHDGPHAAPLVVGERVLVVSIDATVRAFAVADGTPIWVRELRRDHGVTLPQAGYAASPLLDVAANAVLLPGLGGDGPGLQRVDAPGLGVLRLDVETGRTLWNQESFPSSHASPIEIEVAGARLAVFHGMEHLIAIRPQNGEVLWRYRLRDGAADNVSFTPVWWPDNRILLLSHAYDSTGAQAIAIDPHDLSPERIWSNPRLKVEHGNGLSWNGLFLGSDGGEPGFLVALDATTGELRWKERLPKANLVGVEGQLVLVLDSDGTLHLAKPTRRDSGIVSSIEVLDERAWTAPTLVGRTLYLRDAYNLVALRLP